MEERLYWINQDGVQAGPLTAEQLSTMALLPSAHVWRAGMTDWMPITAMEELRGIVPAATPTTPPALDGQPAAMPEIPAPAAGQPEPVAPANATPVAPAGQPAPVEEPCPPTNIIWAVISLLLCCLPLGIVSLIYGIKVSSAYYSGNLPLAKHYSEVSAWWCIAAIVLGIVFQPLLPLLCL